MSLVDKLEKTYSHSQLTTFVNPYSYLILRRHQEVYEEFDQILIDGTLLTRILMLIGRGKYKRVSFDMTSLAKTIFQEASDNKTTIYIIGSKSVHLNSAIGNLKREFSGLNVVGSRDGYFKTPAERLANVSEVAELSPSIVVCGMGTPVQEKYLVDLKRAGWEGRAYTCGGFIHQTANELNYYPKFVDDFNVRWIYRIYDEPKLAFRYFILYPVAIFTFIYDSMFSSSRH